MAKQNANSKPTAKVVESKVSSNLKEVETEKPVLSENMGQSKLDELPDINTTGKLIVEEPVITTESNIDSTTEGVLIAYDTSTNTLREVLRENINIQTTITECESITPTYIKTTIQVLRDNFTIQYSLCSLLRRIPIYGNRNILLNYNMDNSIKVIKNGFSSYDEALTYLKENRSGLENELNFVVMETFDF